MDSQSTTYKFGMFKYKIGQNHKEYGVVIDKIIGENDTQVGVCAMNVYRMFLKPKHVKLRDVRWFELINNSVKELTFEEDRPFLNPKREIPPMALAAGVYVTYNKIKEKGNAEKIYDLNQLQG